MRKISTLFLSSAFALCGMAQEPLLSVTFDADGPVLGGGAKSEASHAVEAVGTTKTIYNAATGKWLGTTDQNYGVFKVTYDADDAVGTAFSKAATWELLFSLQHNQCVKTTPTASYNGTGKFFSSQQGGGWSMRKTAADDLLFAYCTGDAATENKVGGGNVAYLQTGQYYHIVVTADQTTKKLVLYFNGKKVADADVDANDFRFPQIGTATGLKGMMYCLGGDPSSDATKFEQTTRASFVFANVYEGALTEEQVAKLYDTQDVKYFTETKKPTTTDLIMDPVFGKDGAVTDASAYKGSILTAGTMVTQYNADQKRYEIYSEEANNANFYYRVFGDEPSIQKQMGDQYSYEVYMKAATATPAAIMSALSAQQSGGFGFEFQTTGVIKSNFSTYGYRTSKSAAGAMNVQPASEAGALDTEWAHYIVSVDRTTLSSVIYKNGVKIAEASNTADSPARAGASFPYAPHQWFCINGDASSNINKESCDYPFQGQISIARVWGKALTAVDAQALYQEAVTAEYDVAIDAKGSAVCYPYAVTVPAGVDACVAVLNAEKEVELKKYAEAGEVIPYGTAVVLIPRTGGINVKMAAADLSTATVKDAPAENLLEGSYAFKTAGENELYNLVNGEFKVAAAGDVLPCTAWLPYADKEGNPYKIASNILNGVDKVVLDNAKSSRAYNLQGQPVNEDTYKGIVIKNGKKYLNK